MTRISVSAPSFDIDGSEMVSTSNRQGLFDVTRRVSRIATLDGSAAINDFGYSPADRRLVITWTPRVKALSDNIRRMSRQYSRLIVSFSDGCFIGAPESFTESRDENRLTVLIERQLSE